MIGRRFFLTGLAAGIAAPLIVPRSSLMVMPRVPLIVPKGGAHWNGEWFPTVDEAIKTALDYLHNTKWELMLDRMPRTVGRSERIDVYKTEAVYDARLNSYPTPDLPLKVNAGDTVNIHHTWNIKA